MAFFRTCDGVGRRDFLKAGVVGGTGLTLASYAQLAAASNLDAAAKGKSAIFVNLNGGPSHMDTFDPKPDAPSEYRGEFKTIQTCLPGVVISEHLPKIATCMDKFALLRGVSHSVAAHELGTKYVNTGNRPLPSLEFPGYGAVLTKERPSIPELPPFVAIPNSAQRPGYLGVRYAPMNTTASPQIGQPFRVRGISMSGGLTVEDVERRRNLLTQLDRTFSDVEQDSQLLEGMDEFGRQAHTVITSAKARDAFDIGKESPDFTKQFGSSSLGASCLLALRLVESGVRFVTLSNGGWDTHRDNWNVLKTKQLPALDEALFGLFTGLAARGLLDSTVVYVTGEFGRTPKINTERIGRDHYPRNMFMLLGGGGIKGGRVYGKTDERGSKVVEKAAKVGDLNATIGYALGLPLDQVVYSPSMRPFTVADKGKPLVDLFA